MNHRFEFAGAVVLFGAIAGLAVILVWNVERNERNYDEFVKRQTPPPAQAEWTPERISALRPFPEDKDVFANKWPPRPTPTPVILPVPTPTPTPFAVWDVLLIVGDSVQVRDDAGNHYLKEGDVLNGVRITNVDWRERTVRVRDEAGGREKTLGISEARGAGRKRR